jgi:hypothetical protein
MIAEEKRENSIETEAAPKVAPADTVSIEDPASELTEARWSVVSFDKCEARGLTYPQAQAKLDELLARGVYGLCVVTDEVGNKVAGGK